MAETSPPGKIIFLNGTSSAGKTTLAQALQPMLPDPWLHIALDQFRDAMPGQYRGLNSPPGTTGHAGLNVVPVHSKTAEGEDFSYTDIQFGPMGERVLKGMRRAIAAIAGAGNNVIIDDLLLQPAFLQDYLEVLRPYSVLFVGMRCAVDVINERETTRPGRFPGTAMGQFERVHVHEIYDLEVDSAALSPAQCAEVVIESLANPPQPSAFERLFTLQQSRNPA